MKKILLSVVVLLVIVASASWAYRAYRSENKAAPILYGNVDIREVTLGFRVPGKLAKLLYDEGDKVKAGEVIAIIGNTGTLTNGPHLHFELWQNGRPINPALVFKFD